MHIAHQALFARLQTQGGILVIDNGDERLTPENIRQEYTDKPIFTYSLEEIRDLDGKAFIQKVCEDFPALKKIVVGYDFRFGKERLYCADDIRELCDLEVVIVEEIRHNGMSVHSGIIKELIMHGDIIAANELLNRPYKVIGQMIRGQGIGKKQLFPTINLDVGTFLLPDEGVYASRTEIEGRVYDSVTFVGHRVSTDRQFSVETHLLHETPPECMKAGILFYRKIRENKRYTDMETLKARIKEDIMQAEQILKEFA